MINKLKSKKIMVDAVFLFSTLINEIYLFDSYPKQIQKVKYCGIPKPET
jgi:hypothetical protein